MPCGKAQWTLTVGRSVISQSLWNSIVCFRGGMFPRLFLLALLHVGQPVYAMHGREIC